MLECSNYFFLFVPIWRFDWSDNQNGGGAGASAGAGARRPQVANAFPTVQIGGNSFSSVTFQIFLI